MVQSIDACGIYCDNSINREQRAQHIHDCTLVIKSRSPPDTGARHTPAYTESEARRGRDVRLGPATLRKLTRYRSDKAVRRNVTGMKADTRRVIVLRDGAPKKVANQQGGSLPKTGKVVITGVINHYTNNNIFLKGADSMKPTPTKAERPPREPNAFTRRIGSTTYTVGVHFSNTSKDTVNDKIVRLVRREAEEKAGAV